MVEKEIVKISKFLSLILRHRPEMVGIVLDENGWTDVQTLIHKCDVYAVGVKFNFDDLKYVVATNNKKRFSFNEDFSKIRASQGHSVEVDLGYKPQQPPEKLYHGTGRNSVSSILKTGLEKRGRQHVHLCINSGVARTVGARHGVPVVFVVDSGDMARDGFEFFLSDNGVWLTDNVPRKYIGMSIDDICWLKDKGKLSEDSYELFS